tara:strand:- start:47 stop:1663 length:1617 start_codon:yes stop_codon:yes gene_type:complete
MNTKQFIQLLEAEIEDFVQTQAEKIVKFEDDPMAYILQKYPSLKGTLEDLMTTSFEDYITGIYVMAPKPTTFKILLHNGQHFYLTYAKDSYIAKIAGKKYYLLNIGEEEYAIKSIADLLIMGMPPGAEGPESQEDNEMTGGLDAEDDEDTSTDDTGGDDEELAETKETEETKAPIQPKAKIPLKFKILKESVEKKNTPLKFRILKEALSAEAQQAKEILKQNFDLEEKNFMEMTSTNFKVLMDNSERRDFLKKASQLDDFEFELKGASVGRLKYQPEDQTKPILIYAKPANVQGLGSAGKQNEDNFIRNINEKIAEAGGSADINIIASNSETLITKGVTEVRDSSTAGAGKGDKSDAQFLVDGKVLQNISLKQAGGFRWASVKSDPEFRPFIDTFIEKSLAGDIKGFKLERNTEVAGEKYLMFNDKGERVTLIVIEDFPPGFEERVVFGPETPKTVVVGGTFSKDDKDFKLNGNQITVEANGIYKTLDDIEKTGQEPVFVIAQHAKMSYGLDFRIFPANKAKLGPRSRGIKLSYNDVV